MTTDKQRIAEQTAKEIAEEAYDTLDFLFDIKKAESLILRALEHSEAREARLREHISRLGYAITLLSDKARLAIKCGDDRIPLGRDLTISLAVEVNNLLLIRSAFANGEPYPAAHSEQGWVSQLNAAKEMAEAAEYMLMQNYEDLSPDLFVEGSPLFRIATALATYKAALPAPPVHPESAQEVK